MNEGILGIAIWDWVAIAIYLLGITAIGVWTATRVKDTADFFMGGRTHNRWFMMFFAFGAGTSGNDAVGVSAKTYTSGMSGIWYQWLWLFCTPFYWLIAPVMRRMRCLTTGDYFAQRYDGSVEALYAIIGSLVLTLNMGTLLRGGGEMIEALSGGQIPWQASVCVMTVLFVAYGAAGGLTAAIITDFIQGLLTIALSFMLLPVAMNHVGGMAGLREKIGDPNVFTIVSPGEINFMHIFMLCSMALIGIVTQPHIMGVCAAGRTENDGRFGFATGNLLKRFCTVAWMMVGLCGIAMYSDLTSENADQIYGRVAKDLLPTISVGLIGIFLAALLASIMSSCDAFMVSISGLFTQNFYRRHFVKDKPEEHYVMVGRIAGVSVVVISLSIAFLIPDVRRGLELFFQAQALMGAAFWLGLFWRGATPKGVLVGTSAAFGVWLLTTLPTLQPWYVENLPEFMIWSEKLRVSYGTLFFLSTSFIVTIIASFLTRRVEESRLNQFYECIRTPVTTEEPHGPAFTLPEGVEPANPRKIVNHPDLEIYVPSPSAVIGFAIFWGFVLGLIGFVYWVAGLGA